MLDVVWLRCHVKLQLHPSFLRVNVGSGIFSLVWESFKTAATSCAGFHWNFHSFLAHSSKIET